MSRYEFLPPMVRSASLYFHQCMTPNCDHGASAATWTLTDAKGEPMTDEPEDQDPGPGAVIEGPDAEPDTDETAPTDDEVVEPTTTITIDEPTLIVPSPDEET